MNSPLNISVSCFKNYGTPDDPKSVNLLKWLHSAKYAAVVQQIRQVEEKKERDKLKSTLPAITPSGLFSYRATDQLIQHSGFVQFDIDFQDNTHVDNYDELKSQLCNISNVAYCGLSVSGRGYWGLVPIQYPEKHKEHFRAIHKAFKSYGLHIDTAPQNVASLRGYSFDPDGYFNHNAAVFKYLDEPAPRNVERTHYDNDSRSDVEALIEKIQAGRVDITAGYDSWLKIGFAFSQEFGEGGRDYFHTVSQWHPDYNERETDRQFTHCIKANGQGVTISSFFYLCKAYGITLKTSDSLHCRERDRALDGEYESEKSGNSAKNDYPASFDEVQPPEPGSPADVEVIRHVSNDADAEELQQLMITDPVLAEIIQKFDCEMA